MKNLFYTQILETLFRLVSKLEKNLLQNLYEIELYRTVLVALDY